MNGFQMSLLVLFHPFEAFRQMNHDRSRFKYQQVIILLFAFVAVRFIYIFTIHFPLAAILPFQTNVILELVRMLLPVLTWSAACYAITSIMDGETLMREALMSTVYSMLPYIVFAVPLSLLSNILARDEAVFYSFLEISICIWVVSLVIISIKTMNEYSIGKTLLVCILSIMAVLIIWAVMLLIYALGSQIMSFVSDVCIEIRMLYFE